ncbi:carbohydrate binding domain-containing protein [Streptomyces sp. NPDC006274]|uniref:carbohydrate binding domain-containing protein n=1 Tax=unclassified Streptomyces TaxID=2593676 RepID=UPI0033AF5CD5
MKRTATWLTRPTVAVVAAAGIAGVLTAMPAGAPPPFAPSSAAKNTATVYYSTATLGWTSADIHHQPAGGAWTAVPGVGMRKLSVAAPGTGNLRVYVVNGSGKIGAAGPDLK